MRSSSDPLVSVLMPAFNRERFIGQAIASVLTQTLSDFELVIVDDGSTDGTAGVVRSFEDPRIRLVQQERNLGIPLARNRALDEARGRYIAWLDSDDTARPRRLVEQVRFLEKHPECALVGACAGKLDEGGRRIGGVRVPPFDAGAIQAWLLFRSPFQQSSLMGRAAILKQFPYHHDFAVCEDFELFTRLARRHRLANLPAVLIDRRLHAGQTVGTGRCSIDCAKAEILRPVLEQLCGAVGDSDLSRHLTLGLLSADADIRGTAYLDWAEDWLIRLQRENAKQRLVDENAMAFAAAFFWWRACAAESRRVGPSAALRRRMGSRLARGWMTPPALSWACRALPLKLMSNLTAA